MPEESTYLELSELNGSHKFYEVNIDGVQVLIRYGRIGTQGQTKVKSYPTLAKAQADAAKKIQEKLRKGYKPAVMGVRKKRPVTRRQIESDRSTAWQAPVLWKFASGSPALGVFVDEDRCLVGNEAGDIYSLSHAGSVQNQFRLPDGVKCLINDDGWLYAGCDNGKVYDLTGKIPRVAYEIAPDVDIFWLDIQDAILGVSDADGGITIIDREDESQWQRQSEGQYGWMVRCDEIGVYHGHAQGVTMYDWEDGQKIWNQETRGEVLFGWQEEAMVYASTSRNLVYCLSKKGEVKTVYQCDAPVYACATAADGEYIFAADNCSSIYCFNESGDRRWKLATGCGSAFSMQFFQERLYIVTTNGTLACIDAREVALSAAQVGTIPQSVSVKVPSQIQAAVASSLLEETAQTGAGVVVECYREGDRLRIRAISPGYNPNWKVQFPDIRAAGARYLVDEVRESSRGGFYRAYGEIKRLVISD